MNWWLRPRHLAKLSKAFSEVQDWEGSQSTNNPVESINKTSKTTQSCSLKEAIQHVFHEDKRHALLISAVQSGRSISYNHTPRQKRKRKKVKDMSMGDALNPPDSKKKLAKKKIPKGEKAVGHLVDIEYQNGNEGTKWHRGRIILYNKSKGYCIRFEGEGPDGDSWEKGLSSDDVKFIS